MLAISIGLGFGVAPARAQVQLQFWDMIWGPPEYAATAQKLVDRYNASQSEVKVVYRSVAWKGWYETFITAVASGSAPDMSTGAGFQAVGLYDQGAILPVDDLIEEMKADGSIADFPPNTLEAMKYDGHYVALPWSVDVRVMLYREDLLQAKGISLPTNWDEFRKAAKTVTGDGVYGFVSAGDSSGVHSVFATTINNGGGLFDADGKVAVDSPANIEALNFLAGLVEDGSVNPASVGYGSSDRRESFLKGRAAFVLDTPGIASSVPDVADKIKILPPLKSASGNVGTVIFVDNIMAYKQTKHPKETLAFMRWWSENQKELWTEGHTGSLPARHSFMNDPYFKRDANVAYAVEAYLPIAKPISAIKGGSFPQLNEIDGETSLTTLAQQLWQGRAVADIVKPVQDRISEIMSK